MIKNGKSEENSGFDIFRDPLPEGVNCLKRHGIQTVDDLIKSDLESIAERIGIRELINGSPQDDTGINKCSVKQIIAFPDEHVGKSVSVIEKLAVAKNDIKRKSFTVYASKGKERHQYNTDVRIEVFYRNISESVKNLVMVDADLQRIHVEGTVYLYSDSDGVYIDASKITFTD
jgi:hypothetical protein